MIQHCNHLVYLEGVARSNLRVLRCSRWIARHHMREQVYKGMALSAHNVAKHFVANGRIVILVTLQAL